MIDNANKLFNENIIIVEKEIYQTLKHLNLNQVKLIDESALVQEVTIDLTQNPENKAGLYVYRNISKQVFMAVQSKNERLKEEAFQWLGGYLYHHLYQTTKHDKALAEDLTNMSLLKIYQNLGNCHNPNYFLKWTLQIAYREFLQYKRKRERETNSEFLNYLPDENSLEPGKIVVNREVLELILKYIYELKAGKRTNDYQYILIGTYFLDQSDSEIGNRLKLTPTQVQKLRYQALLILRGNEKLLENLR